MAITWAGNGGRVPFSPKPADPIIDWQDPLAHGLVFAVDYAAPSISSGIELVFGGRGTYTGATPTIGPTGMHMHFGGTSNKDIYTTRSAVNSLAQMSVEILVNPGSGAAGDVF